MPSGQKLLRWGTGLGERRGGDGFRAHPHSLHLGSPARGLRAACSLYNHPRQLCTRLSGPPASSREEGAPRQSPCPLSCKEDASTGTVRRREDRNRGARGCSWSKPQAPFFQSSLLSLPLPRSQPLWRQLGPPMQMERSFWSYEDLLNWHLPIFLLQCT